MKPTQASGFFVYILAYSAGLSRVSAFWWQSSWKNSRFFLGRSKAKAILEEKKKMEEATIQYGWDGEYFLCAYDAKGEKVGSHENKEGKIFIEPQVFCVMAGIGHELGYGKKPCTAPSICLVASMA